MTYAFLRRSRIFSLIPLLAVAGTAGAQTPTVAKSVKVGAGIYEIVASSKGTIWVATAGVRDKTPGAIYGLNASTLEVKQTIDVAAAPAYGLGLNDATQTLYTSNTRNGSVSAIDAQTGKILKTISRPEDPRAHLFDVLVDEVANRIYVSVAATPATVWVIDGKSNELLKVIDSVGARATGLALDHANNHLFVSSMGTNEIAVVDLATDKIIRRIPTDGKGSTQLAFDPKTNRLFVTNQQSGDISVIDTKAGAVIRKVQTGAGALGIGFDAQSNRIIVANRQASTVTVIDGATYNVLSNLTAGSLPNTVATDPAGKAVYITSKAKSGGRGAAPVDDPSGDVVTLIKW